MTPSYSLALLLFIGATADALAQAAEAPLPVLQYQFESNRAVLDEDDDPATNVSGIACMPPSGDKRVCMVINDEDRRAILLEMSGKTLTRKAFVPLIGKQHSSQTLGERPSGTACSGGTKKFKDLDGEAVTYQQDNEGSYFYVFGSHGCSRKDSEFRESIFVVARVQVDAQGNVIGEVATTYRLAPVLKAMPDVGGFFGKDLTSLNGLNIEGAAIVGDRLLIGLRAPAANATAYLVSLKTGHLFAKENAPAADAQLLPVALKEGEGIRDIARLDDGRVLLLTGPAQDQTTVPYRIGILNVREALASLPAVGGKRAPVGVDIRGTLEAVGKGKAEGLEVLSLSGRDLSVVVVYDGVPEGGARAYKLVMD